MPVSVKYDRSAGIVRVTGDGYFSHDDEQKAARVAQTAIAQCRAEHNDLKVLIVCASMVQDADVMQSAANREAATTGPRDRVAFLCENSLTKLQASRIFKGEKCQCFLSENAAVTWLLANRETKARAA